MFEFRVCGPEGAHGGCDAHAGYGVVVASSCHFPRDSGADEGEDLSFTDSVAAQVASYLRGFFGVLSEVAGVGDGGEIDGGGGEAAGGAVLRQAVEEGVCGGVGGLASVADGAGGGGDDDEEVEGVGGEGVVEVPGAGYFGFVSGGVWGDGHLFEKDVLVGL